MTTSPISLSAFLFTTLILLPLLVVSGAKANVWEKQTSLIEWEAQEFEAFHGSHLSGLAKERLLKNCVHQLNETSDMALVDSNGVSLSFHQLSIKDQAVRSCDNQVGASACVKKALLDQVNGCLRSKL